ncbi:hypothetical protein C4553_03835 [Candidatus Parcubacteria bacterium]|nr:MAG: hypothetical protein C4553_03835 [Candidatus Parcubacteria bacterium]
MSESPKVKAVAVAVVVMLAACASASSAFAQDRQLFELRPIERKWEEPREEKDRKVDFLFKASRVYLAAGTGLDAVTTVRVLNHPSMAYRADGSALGRSYGVETGWARALGKRNTGAVVAANVGLNLGVDLLSRKLYRKGGRWRYLAIGLNLWKATDSLKAGIHNINYHSNGFDRRMREATGYQGTIVWSSK